MKKWVLPTIEILDLKDTACWWWGIGDEVSGEEVTPQLPTPTPSTGNQCDQDLGTCNSAYWAGNGLTLEQAQQNNPYWSGSWGN